MSDQDAVVADNPGASRYEVRVGDQVAGFADYELMPGRIVFTHTEVDRAYEGHGLASRLAAWALDDARARQLAVTARCAFIAGYIDEHPAYADLLSPPGGAGH